MEAPRFGYIRQKNGQLGSKNARDSRQKRKCGNKMEKTGDKAVTRLAVTSYAWTRRMIMGRDGSL